LFRIIEVRQDPLKAWIDMICRARLSFRYTESGPHGMLRDRPIYLVMASGGMPFGSPVDFVSGYLRHILHSSASMMCAWCRPNGPAAV
jgi:FMN-dependent NADH-azoreductase